MKIETNSMHSRTKLKDNLESTRIGNEVIASVDNYSMNLNNKKIVN